MYIDQGTPDLDEGELPVHVIPNDAAPRVVVDLAAHGRVRLVMESDEDADRIIRAMVRAKEMRSWVARPHQLEPGDGGHCTKCGVYKKGHPEPVITDSETRTAGVGGVLFPAANPPHHVIAGEQACTAQDNESVGYICTAQDGHDGPDHIAYKPNGGEYHRWPVAADRDQPASPDAAEALYDAITAGTPVIVVDDEPASAAS